MSHFFKPGIGIAEIVEPDVGRIHQGEGQAAELAFWLEEMSSFWLELESAKPTMLPG